MARERKSSARYIYIRGHQTLWKGDPAEDGSLFRTIVIASNEFSSTVGVFQVYALEGIGAGIKDGKFADVEEKPTDLFDEDMYGLVKAGEKFRDLMKDSEANGFTPITLWDIIEFESKVRESQ